MGWNGFKLMMGIVALSSIVPINGKYLYQTGYYEVPVDHFTFTTNASFQMKYLYNDSWWDRSGNGPIFFYTGNEGAIELFAENTGFMWDIAPEFGALVLFAEHRYYGTSLPFGNESFSAPEKSGYLTSEQALADFADFLEFYKYHHGGSRSPIIAFGGSYGGMLTAWMRMKYPHIIQGGIAASAPILQFPGLTPCGAFGRILTNAFQKESTQCVDSIRKSWKVLTEFGENERGRDWLNKNWKFCSPLNTTQDVETLKSWLTDVYGNLGMVNYPYSTNFLAPLPPFPVRAVCSKLPDSNLPGKHLLRSLFKGISIYFNGTGSRSCLDISTEATSALGDLGWDYQSCTEMVMPMCYDGVHDMFEPTKWDYPSYAGNCSRKWGVRTRPWMTQIIYGGHRILPASNIVFSNGLLDPWSGGGVLSNLSNSVLAIVIPDGAHHLDLRGSNPKDPPSVINARKFEKAQIKNWIKEYHHCYHRHL